MESVTAVAPDALSFTSAGTRVLSTIGVARRLLAPTQRMDQCSSVSAVRLGDTTRADAGRQGESVSVLTRNPKASYLPIAKAGVPGVSAWSPPV